MTPLPWLSGLFAIISPSDEVDGWFVRFIESTPADDDEVAAECAVATLPEVLDPLQRCRSGEAAG